MSGTYNPTIPIEVGPTSPRMHITAERALDLPCKREFCRCCGSGNGWFREARQPPAWPDVTREKLRNAAPVQAAFTSTSTPRSCRRRRSRWVMRCLSRFSRYRPPSSW